MTRETVSVLLTPPGRGAIAAVLVEGPRAHQIVDALFHAAAGRPLAEYPLGRIAFGRWASEHGEELVVCRKNEEQIEVHCHGGPVAAAAILESLAAAGCANLPWQAQQELRGADPISNAAIVALAKARTERTAAILLDQYHGALRAELAAIVGGLHAASDESLAEANKRLATLRRRIDLGRHLTKPYRVVLAGSPNVGKSSLINALAGYRRSIVFDEPGTTRDVVTAVTALGGWPVELADTAGLRDGVDELEAAGVERARATLQQADLRVLAFDLTRPWSDQDEALCADWPGAVLVFNKSDLPEAVAPRRPRGVRTSATTRAGIDDLIAVLASRLAPEAPAAGAAVPFCDSQFQAICEALLRLSEHDPSGAAAALRAIM